MNAKEKAHTGGNRAGLKKQRHSHYKPSLPKIKAFVVKLAVYGFIPASLASWLTRKGGVPNE